MHNVYEGEGRPNERRGSESQGQQRRGREDGLSWFFGRSYGLLFLMMWHLCGIFYYLDNYKMLLWGAHYLKHRHNEWRSLIIST